METRTEGRAGWVELTRAGVHVLAKGDGPLRDRLTSALTAAGGDTLPDVVTDALTIGGVRGAPDFAIVDEAGGRALVRGSARVELIGADGRTREVRAPARAPWTDEDIEEGTSTAVLSTGEPELVAPPAGPAPGDDAAGPERPQFVDGHLVGPRVAASPAEGRGGFEAPAAGGLPTSTTEGRPEPAGGPSTGVLPVLDGTTDRPREERAAPPARLVLSTGEVVTLDRGVVLGRSPRTAAAVGAAGEPHLVRVPSPDNEISRSHVEVYPEGGRLLVRDLGSTNGTTVTTPGGSPARLGGGPQLIEPGTTIRLAGRAAVTVEAGP